MSKSLEYNKHLIKYLKKMTKEQAVVALDNLLKLNMIKKVAYKVILKEISK